MAQNRSVDRVMNFDLSHRGLISGIYGSCTNDVFIDSDFRVCEPMQILYRSFKQQGCLVVFYSCDEAYNFWSYSEEDLAAFHELTQKKKTSEGNATRHIAKIDSPFGRSRRANRPSQSRENPRESSYEQIQLVSFPKNHSHDYYRIRKTIDPFDDIVNYARNHPDTPTVVVFSNANTDTYENIDRILSKLDTLLRDYEAHELKLKIVAYYNTANYEDVFNGEDNVEHLFKNNFFRDVLQGASDSEGNPNNPGLVQLYNLAGPSADEFRNLLLRRRGIDKLSGFFVGKDIDRISQLLSQKTNVKSDDTGSGVPFNYERMSGYHLMPVEDFKKLIENLDTQNAMDKLTKDMLGTEKIVEQFKHYLSVLKKSKESKDYPRFRPHMVFMGNPGTGKTTVARCFADVLRENNLLSRGHLIEATVADMVGQYVGETRIKTQALCDRARGGVLFVDEAYGLMSGHDSHGGVDYGKEAIEVLIQFMENSRDSLVILAGYKDEIQDLIQNGNQGFMRRFNDECFFYFEDYQPDVLYEIFKRQLKGRNMTEEFDKTIRRLIARLFSLRNARWGNAGEMEKLASGIMALHRRRDPDDLQAVDVEDIPQDKLLLIKELNPSALDDVMEDINEMIGLRKVKSALKDLITSSMSTRMVSELTSDPNVEKDELNFIFLGNPGTGKTTVAKLLGKILNRSGMIATDELVQLKIGDVVHSEVGGTAKTVDSLFKNHSGKVIFLDEAYELARQGQNAITPLTDNLYDDRYRGNQAFVMAGYTREMTELISQNPGLKSRFPHVWHFEDYSDEELWQIFEQNVHRQKRRISDIETCKRLALKWFADERASSSGNDFGNARLCGKNGLLGKVMAKYGLRLMEQYEKLKQEGDLEYVLTYIPADFPNYIAER